MTVTRIQYDTSARASLAIGVDAIADVVALTLGPRGRSVLLDAPFQPPVVTSDGSRVAEEVVLEEPLANVGVQLLREVAKTTAEAVGDGTTTAVVVARAIFSAGNRLVAAGADPMALKRGIDAATKLVCANLASQSRATTGRLEIARVGSLSARDDAVGELLADAISKLGTDAVITVEDSDAMVTTLELTLGAQFERGYLSPYFATDIERMECVFRDVHVLLHKGRLSSLQSLAPLLEQVVESGKPLLIVAEDVEGDALAGLVLNKLKNSLQVCAVKAPGFGEMRSELLSDLALVTGGILVSEDLGVRLENVRLADLGHAATVRVDKERTILIDGSGSRDALEGTAQQIRTRIADATSEHDRGRLRTRLAGLQRGIAIVKVGGLTDTEREEKKSRVEDALHATRAAIAEGVVPGGGVALLRALPALTELDMPGDAAYGVQLVRQALAEPLLRMVGNAGREGTVVVDKVLGLSGSHGFNLATEVYEDLLLAGVLDATKVLRVALENAASMAGLMLTVQAAITRVREVA